MNKMRTILAFMVPLLLLSACGGGRGNEQLARVDSLVIAEAHDSAYQTLMAIDERDITTDADRAHYNLLKVQTSLLTSHPVSADSLLNGVMAYYEEHVDHEKLADAYYYKAICEYKNEEIQQSIVYYKKAEQQAKSSGNLRQQYKIAEGISFVNGACAKYDLQLIYAKKALELSRALNNKKLIAYSLYRIDIAYSDAENEDSAIYYLNQIPQYLKFVDPKSRSYVLSNLGYLFKENSPSMAKRFLLESLMGRQSTATYEHLAEMAYNEGHPEEAYQYWKKALLVQDATPKDIAIHNIIEYDLERGKTDSICERINEIIAIRDSIESKLKNDTIRQLQAKFDIDAAVHKKDQAIIRWQWALIGVIALVVCLALYIVIKRYKEKLLLRSHQMQIQEYMNQISLLKESGEGASQQIELLSDEIRRIMDEKSPRLSQGRMLYDSIMEGRPIVKWSADDEKKFIEYFTATNYRLLSHLRKEPRREPLTDHKLIYLLLKEMGKTDKEICDIMGLSDAGLRSIRNRTKPQKD